MREIKIILKEFCSLFGNCICIIALMLSAFLLLINVYHGNEISYKYSIDFNDSDSYNGFKNKVKDLEENIKSVNVDTLQKASSNEKMVFRIAKLKMEECVNNIKKSKYYNIDKTDISYKDIYEYNMELYSNIQNECLFNISFAIKDTINTYNIEGIDYNLTDQVNANRNSLVYYSDYLTDQLLGNGSYFYTTETTKTTINNQLYNYISLNKANYDYLLNNFEQIVNWYMNKTGGLK